MGTWWRVFDVGCGIHAPFSIFDCKVEQEIVHSSEDLRDRCPQLRGSTFPDTPRRGTRKNLDPPLEHVILIFFPFLIVVGFKAAVIPVSQTMYQTGNPSANVSRHVVLGDFEPRF